MTIKRPYVLSLKYRYLQLLLMKKILIYQLFKKPVYFVFDDINYTKWQSIKILKLYSFVSKNEKTFEKNWKNFWSTSREGMQTIKTFLLCCQEYIQDFIRNFVQKKISINNYCGKYFDRIYETYLTHANFITRIKKLSKW